MVPAAADVGEITLKIEALVIPGGCESRSPQFQRWKEIRRTQLYAATNSGSLLKTSEDASQVICAERDCAQLFSNRGIAACRFQAAFCGVIFGNRRRWIS